MNKLNSEQMKPLIISIVLMIVGILFCCSLAMGINGLSVITGILLLICGIVMIISSIAREKFIFKKSGMIGVLLSSLGILFIVNKLAGVIFALIPWFLIVLGCVLIVDAFLGKYSRKENNLVEFIIKIVLGSIAIILGLCLKLIDGFLEYAVLILGILMLVYSIYLVFNIIFKKQSNNI